MAASIPTAMNPVPDLNHPLARAFASLDPDQSSLHSHQYSFSPYWRIASSSTRPTSPLSTLRSCSPAAHDSNRGLKAPGLSMRRRILPRQAVRDRANLSAAGCIIKNCAHGKTQTSDNGASALRRRTCPPPHPLHDRALRSPRRQSRHGGRRASHARRFGHQAWREENPPSLSGQDPRRLCRFNCRRLLALQPV